MEDPTTLFDFTSDATEEQRIEQEIKANKLLRKTLDSNLQYMKKCPGTRERNLAITNLQQSIMWLGMDLKRLHDGQTPYKESYNPENIIIEPTDGGLKL